MDNNLLHKCQSELLTNIIQSQDVSSLMCCIIQKITKKQFDPLQCFNYKGASAKE